MSEHIIENSIIRLTVAEHGAEIRSLVRKSDGKELMWQADAAFWGRTSPVLFPLVGNYYEKESVYNGRTYTMGQHGFARDMEFELTDRKEDELLFRLTDDESTREKYPFKFILTLSYKLDGENVIVGWKVENNNDETMYFSIGGHPAFNCDLNTYSLRFEKDGKVNDTVTANIIAGDGSGCLSDEQEQLVLKDGMLTLSDELFDKDALIFENRQTDTVTIVDDKGKDVLSVSFDAPLFGVWSPAKKHAPFVCIEPWYGRCDRIGFNKKLEEREYGNKLDKGESFQVSYTIKA